MATIKSGVPASIIARASADALAEAGSSARPERQNGIATPVVSLLPREVAAVQESSPAARGTPQTIASPGSRLPKSSIPSPSTSRSIPGPSALPRTRGPSTAETRLQRPPDIFRASAKTAMQPLSRGVATRPPSNGSNGQSNGHHDTVDAAINDIRHDDPERSVDALKAIQGLLASEPDSFLDSVQALVETLMDEMERTFTPPDNLRDPRYFRLVKHLIQTLSGVSASQDLVRRLSDDDVYSMLSGLSLRLVQADMMGGSIQELANFFNMILIQTFSIPDRMTVFKAMFRLLLDLTKDFSTYKVRPDTEIAAHADLVLKCLWKRSRNLDDDFRSGRLKPGPFMGVLEDFLQVVGPPEYRKRAAAGIALGDMPLRTVKTIIQKICRESFLRPADHSANFVVLTSVRE